MERRQLRCPDKIVEGAIQGAAPVPLRSPVPLAALLPLMAQGSLRAPEPVRAPGTLRESMPLRAPGTLRMPVPSRAPGPPRAPGPLRAPEPMTAPGPLRVLTAGVTEGLYWPSLAWPILVGRGVIQGAEEPWMTPSTRAPYSLRLTEGGGTGQCAPPPPRLRPCHGEIFVSLQCTYIGTRHGLHPQTDN